MRDFHPTSLVQPINLTGYYEYNSSSASEPRTLLLLAHSLRTVGASDFCHTRLSNFYCFSLHYACEFVKLFATEFLNGVSAAPGWIKARRVLN